MKILFVNNLYYPNDVGGAERSVRYLAEGLARRGGEAVVVSLAPDGRFSAGCHAGVRTIYLPLANLGWLYDGGARPAWYKMLWQAVDAYNPVMARRLGKVIDAEQPDLVQLHSLKGLSVAAWRAVRRRGLPMVQCLHDYYLGCPRATMFREGRNCRTPCLECRAFGLPRRLLSNLPDAVIGISRCVSDRLDGIGLFRKVPHRAVIFNATEMSDSIPLRKDVPPGGPIRVGYLGRLDRVKGIEVLLEAARLLPAHWVRILVAGKGAPDYERELRDRFDLPNLAFLGHVPPRDLLDRIDVLVVPSTWEEPLGRITFEAFDRGVPVIASRLGGSLELIDEGRTGWFFSSGDALALAEILSRLVAEGLPSARFAEACRRSAERHHPDVVLDQYMAVWRSVLADRQRLPR